MSKNETRNAPSHDPVDRDLDAGNILFGGSPALIVVDMSNGFTSSESPLGGEFTTEIQQAARLCEVFQQQNRPVFYSAVVYDLDTEPDKAKVFRQRLPDLNILKKGSKWCEIDQRLASFVSNNTNHHVIYKQWPSAFFDTALLAFLQLHHVDSLVVCGLTTSGCVRATVIDGLQNDFPVWVASDACGDRNNSAHEANLHDMNAKYAEVKTTKQIISELLSSDLQNS